MAVLVRRHKGLEVRRSHVVEYAEETGLVKEHHTVPVEGHHIVLVVGVVLHIVPAEILRIAPAEVLRIVLVEVRHKSAVGVDLEKARHMVAAGDKGYGKGRQMAAVEVEGSLDIADCAGPGAGILAAHIQDRAMPRSHVEVAGLEGGIDQEEAAGSPLCNHCHYM